MIMMNYQMLNKHVQEADFHRVFFESQTDCISHISGLVPLHFLWNILLVIHIINHSMINTETQGHGFCFDLSKEAAGSSDF